MQEKANFKKRSRQQLEELELMTLAPYATSSRGAHRSRRFEEPEHGYRTAFQRDRDRIIHSRAFRRLKHKRQVFLTSESDHYRTRITHTLEVSQLSRTMARALGLNEDLVEAIALGHDLGHTPFGHLGEVVLDAIMTGKECLDKEIDSQNFGGFKHNYQSIRIVDSLEKKYHFDGLNLTAVVREGILKHTRLKRGKIDFPNFCYDGLVFDLDSATTLEAQVVALCDEIAQRTHDLEDGIRAGLVDVHEVREMSIVKQVETRLNIKDLVAKEKRIYQGLLIRGLINFLVDDVIESTLKNISEFQHQYGRLTNFDKEIVSFSPKVYPLQNELNKFIYKKIIDFSRVQWSDELGKKLIYRLFQAYYRDFNLLPAYIRERYMGENGQSRRKGEQQLTSFENAYFFRIICDYIAGMTDHYAIREAKRLSSLKKMDFEDLHLESALGEQTFADTSS